MLQYNCLFGCLSPLPEAGDCLAHFWDLAPHQDPLTEEAYNTFLNEMNMVSCCNMTICELMSILGSLGADETGLTRGEEVG